MLVLILNALRNSQSMWFVVVVNLLITCDFNGSCLINSRFALDEVTFRMRGEGKEECCN